MMTLFLFGLTVLLGATVISAALPRPTPPPVVYLRAEAPAEASGGDIGFALIIFVVLALIIMLAA
ncbi:hypothetical protein [Chloroflexus sp.]|uniref:hypothetical protein n=1 Tax=Chloroflexus sp. TaxID=1904827 RepID=UPI00298F2CC2|nr:hypothetical protein [Chloroflexus sp.]MCS6887570.1 hypothetical protein [Chloroflexus sp.]MDW8404608.1 hypothetical protein [Chloroflexus sp.]